MNVDDHEISLGELRATLLHKLDMRWTAQENRLPAVEVLPMKPVALILLAAVFAAAHHSFDAEFDRTKTVSLTGIVTKVEWTNPHVWFYVNVKDEATGKYVNWGCEMGSPNALQRSGWTVSTMKEGMTVSLSGSRAKDGTNKVNTSAVFVDGKRLGAASSGQPQ
jgi:hypothetical protein